MSWKLVHSDVQPYFKRSAGGAAHRNRPDSVPRAVNWLFFRPVPQR
jgi:hypothetical protein